MSATESRSEITRHFLLENKLAGWFSWRPDELLMLLGYLPYWGLSFLVSLLDGTNLLFVPELEPQDGIPADTAVITYPWGNLACGDPFEVLRGLLHDELDRRHLKLDSIGTLRNSHRTSLPVMCAEQPPLPMEYLHALTSEMKVNADLESAFLGLYLYKTESEIEQIRLANKVAQLGLDAWANALVPGSTEAETAAAAEAAIHCATGKDGVVFARAWAMVQSGPNTAQAGCFNRSSGRRLQAEDLALIELATCVNGYWSDLTRTQPVVRAEAEAAEVLQAVSNAQQAAPRAIKPGVPANDVDAAARESLRLAGFAGNFTHATGHHTGFRYHDPGFAILLGTHDTLERGMVITIEPGTYISERGFGARIEDNVVVSNGGVEILSAERQERG